MRELLIIRHAIAHERDAKRWPDDDKRPLTAKGKKRFRQAARGIARALPAPDAVFSSPLVRARQTARILQRNAKYPRTALMRELSPDARPQTLIATLRKLHANRIAIVGHEPSLSHLLSDLLQSRSGAPFVLKKGGVAWLDVSENKAKLLAQLPPSVLRELA